MPAMPHTNLLHGAFGAPEDAAELDPQIPPERQLLPAEERIAKASDHTTHQLAHLLQLLEDRDTPPILIDPTPTMNSTGWTFNDPAKDMSKSIGVLNPNSVNVYVGLDTGRADATSRSFPVPAETLMVLPFAVWDLTFGIDPADRGSVGASTAVVWAWRYKTVQPAFMQSFI